MPNYGLVFCLLVLCLSVLEARDGRTHRRPRPAMQTPNARMRDQKARDMKRLDHLSKKPAKNVSDDLIMYVNVGNNNNGDGQSWSTAYNSLATAISAAHNEQQIWVAQGTYTPTTTSGDTTSTFAISLNNLYLYGGFKGTETSVDQRNPTLYPTILSGKIDSTTSSNHVVTISSASSYIDGFTISDGDAAGAQDGTHQCADCFGGGIYFRNPQAPVPVNGSSQEKAKAMAMVTGPSVPKNALSISNCIISNNRAITGAGMFIYANAEVTISDTEFSNNIVVSSEYHIAGGGAIYASVATDLTITTSLFSANVAANRGGAIYADYGIELIVTDSTFSQNSVTNGHGGAVYMTDRCSNSDTTDATITDCTFDHNYASGYGGAAFFYYDCFALLMQNMFTYNSAGLAGGAVANYNAFIGQAMPLNTWSDNSAPSDSDYYYESFPTFKGVTNKVTDFTPYLSTLESNYEPTSQPTQRQTILYVDNSVTSSGSGLTWAQAVKTISEAIVLSQNKGSASSEIWVRGTGTAYTPSTVPAWYDTTAAYYDPVKSRLIDLTSNVALYGGFAGTETARSQRNFESNPTQISAQISATVATYQIVRLGESARIDGFIISDSYGYTDTFSEEFAKLPPKCQAAYLEADIKPELDAYKVWPSMHEEGGKVGSSSSGNSQLHSMKPTRGNGIFANDTGGNVDNVLLVNNYGQLGGGMYVLAHHVYGNNVMFINNVGEYRGGAIQIDVNGAFDCKNCWFEDNATGRKGGAVYLDYKSYLTLNGAKCGFENNFAYDGGGALAVDGASEVSLSCTQVSIDTNWAFQDGGAVYEGSYGWSNTFGNKVSVMPSSTLTMSNNIVYDGMGNGDFFVWNYGSVVNNN